VELSKLRGGLVEELPEVLGVGELPEALGDRPPRERP